MWIHLVMCTVYNMWNVFEWCFSLYHCSVMVYENKDIVLSQACTFVSNVICRGLLFVQWFEMRGGCSFLCWYWWNWWPSQHSVKGILLILNSYAYVMQSVYTLWSMVDHLIKKVYWNNKCLHMKEYIDSICTQAYVHGDIEHNTC